MRKLIKNVSSFFKGMLSKIQKLIHKVTTFIKDLLKKVDKYYLILQKLYLKHVSPIIEKVFSFLKIKVTRKRREALFGYIFVLLWIVGFLVFTLYPMFYSFYLSLHQAYYSLTEGVTTTYIGFTNYLNIFRSQTLFPLYRDYIGRMFISVPLVVVFSIMIAILINNPIKLKGVWRTIFFLPVIIATGPVINELSNQDATSLPSIQDSDVLIYITENLGEWIANPIQQLLTSMLLILWYAGIPILIFLAGLQKIDTSIYEAASIDGASPWDRFWKITLPSIQPLIGVAIIYIVVSMSLFVQPSGILDQTRTHMLVGAPDSAFWFGYGYAAAMAWLYFLLMVIIMAIFVGVMNARRREK
jgi:ABC-type sugar transport system permease subunit